MSISVKFFLSLDSVRGTKVPWLRIWKRGALLDASVFVNMNFSAVTGHKGEGDRDGIFRILNELFICNVFDHFNLIWAPGGRKYVSSSQLF